MPQQTTVGFILMLDTSGTMHDATGAVKIDAKAFVRQARPNHQFGINQFNTTASWVYPTGSSPRIVTIDRALHKTAEAVQNIERYIQPTDKRTNLGEAIQLGNAMIGQATTDVRTFVIQSDGLWNIGPDPSDVLGSQPPIFVAGLGPHLKRQMFEPLLAKNPNSRYYHKPNAYQMMQVFNDISALPPDAGLTANSLATYSGSDYTLTQSIVSEDSEEAQFTVVWSDKRFEYTSGMPSGYLINVVLIDPQERTTDIKPTIAEHGYCIFNVQNIVPGQWQTLVQYSVPQSIYGTSGGFQFDTQVNLHVDAPVVHTAGEPLRFSAKVLDEGEPVEGLNIRAHVTRPIISVENALKKHGKELKSVKPDTKLVEEGLPEEYAKLVTLRHSRMDEGDILAATQSSGTMMPKDDGTYEFTISETHEAGSYSVEVRVTGKNPKTGKSFSRVKSFATLVG